MNLPYSAQLNIERFSRLFDNKSECYKLFWFRAILSKACSGQNEMSFEELIDEMIASAWYMVTEYHLNLGPSDNLEKLVIRLSEISTLSPSSKREEILSFVANCDDQEVTLLKRVLTLNVPYRLQAPLYDNFPSTEWSLRPALLSKLINEQPGLMYYFTSFDGINTRIVIQENWMDYLTSNQEILRGWTDYNTIVYLQRRNPSVPGISDKLYPPIARNLDKVKKYWNSIIENSSGIRDIYGNVLLSDTSISIDHFIPWSYVAHDELWNLSPTTRSINSSKSNHLPKWDEYFIRLAKIEYEAYLLTTSNDKIHSIFDKCAKEHLNNHDITQRLYKPGQSITEFGNNLNEIINPLYKAAKNCGFSEWVYAI